MGAKFFFQISISVSCLLFLSTRVDSQPVNDSISLKKYFIAIQAIQQDIHNYINTIRTNADIDSEIVSSEYNSLHKALFNEIDSIEKKIGLNQIIDSNRVVSLLKGLQQSLQYLHYGLKAKDIKISTIINFPTLFEKAMDLDLHSKSIFSLLSDSDHDAGLTLLRSHVFDNNRGADSAADFLVQELYKTNPSKILPILYDLPGVSNADNMIKNIAPKQAENIYNYAQARNSTLGMKIASNEDPLVQLIVKLSYLPRGRLFFPFIDQFLGGQLDFKGVEKIINSENKVKYYQLLVKTQIVYNRRLIQEDTAVGFYALTKMLRKKAEEDYIYIINRLHEYDDPVRLQVIKQLGPTDIYYLIVLGENSIYTSSYLKLYKRMFELMSNKDSYQLLNQVYFDQFKKFIKIAANYNTLNNFLGKMNSDTALSIMRSFINNLQYSSSLENAVDVADSYASIEDPKLRKLLLNEVDRNLKQLSFNSDKHGTVIYQLLQALFLSLDTTKHIDISGIYGIPDIYSIKNNALKDSSGIIVAQQFFYGDKNGAQVFNAFTSAFNLAEWRIKTNPQWIALSSSKGKSSVQVYSNRPLDTDKYLDIKAQASLSEYLKINKLFPRIVIHRGHSYRLSSTITQLAPSAKIIILGSCGGYRNLAKVLEVSPYAHIVSTKQEGSGLINKPLIVSILETLRKGKDIYWPAFWNEFRSKLKGNKKVDDYIPPYQNLGALFIMAYNKLTQRTPS